MKKAILQFLFGKPIQGEPIKQPTFKTVMPPGYDHMSFTEWAQINNISSNLNRY